MINQKELNRRKLNLSVLGSILVLLVMLTPLATATSSCPGAKPYPVYCSCDNGGKEKIDDANEFRKARKNPKSCCYYKPSITTITKPSTTIAKITPPKETSTKTIKPIVTIYKADGSKYEENLDDIQASIVEEELETIKLNSPLSPPIKQIEIPAGEEIITDDVVITPVNEDPIPRKQIEDILLFIMNILVS